MADEKGILQSQARKVHSLLVECMLHDVLKVHGLASINGMTKKVPKKVLSKNVVLNQKHITYYGIYR